MAYSESAQKIALIYVYFIRNNFPWKTHLYPPSRISLWNFIRGVLGGQFLVGNFFRWNIYRSMQFLVLILNMPFVFILVWDMMSKVATHELYFSSFTTTTRKMLVFSTKKGAFLKPMHTFFSIHMLVIKK
jgi:hypothetical protein